MVKIQFQHYTHYIQTQLKCLISDSMFQILIMLFELMACQLHFVVRSNLIGPEVVLHLYISCSTLNMRFVESFCQVNEHETEQKVNLHRQSSWIDESSVCCVGSLSNQFRGKLTKPPIRFYYYVVQINSKKQKVQRKFIKKYTFIIFRVTFKSKTRPYQLWYNVCLLHANLSIG